MKPFFSIVIPTLNEENFLPRLLRDLNKQKEKNFEIIIVDSFSKDKTKEITYYFRKSLNLQFVQIREKNVAAQRNYGSKLSQGDYLIFFDADIRINSSFTKKAKKIIIKRRGLIFLPYIFPDSEYKQYRPLFDLVNLLVEWSQNLPKRFSLGGTMIVEKALFKLIGGFNEKLYLSEDHELIQRAANWGIRTKMIKEIKTKVSLRRMKKEGQLKFLYKYFVASAHRLFYSEEIKNKIFEYQMGGQLYLKRENKHNKEEFFKYYFNQIKTLFNKLLKD